MAKPLNKELYDKAKSKADMIYKKPSAYKSGYIIKLYKEMGGKFIDDTRRAKAQALASGTAYHDDGERKLKRWFKEKWVDVNPFKNNSSYPVYRPTRRVNKNTPLTVAEISKNNLIEQSNIKQIIKGDKNLKPFKRK